MCGQHAHAGFNRIWASDCLVTFRAFVSCSCAWMHLVGSPKPCMLGLCKAFALHQRVTTCIASLCCAVHHMRGVCGCVAGWLSVVSTKSVACLLPSRTWAHHHLHGVLLGDVGNHRAPALVGRVMESLCPYSILQVSVSATLYPCLCPSCAMLQQANHPACGNKLIKAHYKGFSMH